MLEAAEKIKVQNLMCQRTHLFQRLEVAENIRAYTIQNVVSQGSRSHILDSNRGGSCITEENRAKK